MTIQNNEDDFFKMAKDEAALSTCLRRKVGAIAVRDNIVLAKGHNGEMPEENRCVENGCIRNLSHVPSGVRVELCYGVHAEQNLITQAAKQGISLDGATLYCTHKPCPVCEKLLNRCGISNIRWIHYYP